MPRRSVLVPVGVLAGVLGLTGGVVSLAHSSAPSPRAEAPAGMPPPELASAARATLAHRSLQLRSADDIGVATGTVDTASGDMAVVIRYEVPDELPDAAAQTSKVEMRQVGAVGYTDAPEGLFAFDGAAAPTPSGKPWSAVRLTPEELLEANPVKVLRSLATGENRWPVRRVDAPAGVLRYRLTSAETSPDGADELDIDVSEGEIVRLATRPVPPDLPDCPGTWDDRMHEEPAEAEDVSLTAFTVEGSDRPAEIVPPPAEHVQFVPSEARPTSLSPEDFVCPTDMPSFPADGSDDVPTELPPGLPELPDDLPALPDDLDLPEFPADQSELPADLPPDVPAGE